MNTSVEDELVQEYLARLRTALAGHPADQQREVVADVESHIASARAELPPGEAGVRTVLERLGDPEDIAASAGPALAPPPAAPRPSASGEIIGLVFLALGGLVIPFLGWFVGLVLLWSSRIWTRGDKLLGTLLVPGGPGSLVLWLAAGGWLGFATESCVSGSDLAIPVCSGGPPEWVSAAVVILLVGALVGSVATLVVLARRVADRA